MIASLRQACPIAPSFWCLICCAIIGIGNVMPTSIGDPNSAVNNRNARSNKNVFEGVKGRVSIDGEPLVGALIEAKSLDRPSRMIPEIAILSDDYGNYRWPLTAGRYRMTARLDHYRAPSKLVVVEVGTAATINFRMVPVRRSK